MFVLIQNKRLMNHEEKTLINFLPFAIHMNDLLLSAYETSNNKETNSLVDLPTYPEYSVFNDV